MIPELQGFTYVFRANHGLLHRSLEGLTEAQAMERAGEANPILWVAAHVVTVRCMIAQVLGAKIEVPWGGQFPRGGKVEDVKSWPTLADVRAKWDEAHPAFMAALEGLTAEQVHAKTKAPGLADDVLGVIALGALHDAYHIGQLGAARRRFSLDRLVG